MLLVTGISRDSWGWQNCPWRVRLAELVPNNMVQNKAGEIQGLSSSLQLRKEVAQQCWMLCEARTHCTEML